MKASCAEELIREKILPDVDRYFQIRASMGDQDKVETLLFLIQNVDVFAWSPYEVPKVDLEFIVHKLNVDLSFPPKKQKPRKSVKEHVEAMRQEVEGLKEAEAIKEIFFPKWLANTVVIRKKNGKWRVCVDFTNLNRACLKNAGATYQRMMTRMFRDKIGRTVEVYINNMVVKSKQETRHIEDLQ